jgi:hypothetical protein
MLKGDALVDAQNLLRLVDWHHSRFIGPPTQQIHLETLLELFDMFCGRRRVAVGHVPTVEGTGLLQPLGRERVLPSSRDPSQERSSVKSSPKPSTINLSDLCSQLQPQRISHPHR